MSYLLENYWPLAVFLVAWITTMVVCAQSIRRSEQRIEAANTQRDKANQRTAELRELTERLRGGAS